MRTDARDKGPPHPIRWTFHIRAAQSDSCNETKAKTGPNQNKTTLIKRRRHATSIKVTRDQYDISEGREARVQAEAINFRFPSWKRGCYGARMEVSSEKKTVQRLELGIIVARRMFSQNQNRAAITEVSMTLGALNRTERWTLRIWGLAWG